MTKEDFKKIRKKAGLTQTELADFIGITLRTVQNYEGGENPIPLYIEKLLKYEFNSQNITTLSPKNEELEKRIKELEHQVNVLIGHLEWVSKMSDNPNSPLKNMADRERVEH